MAGLATCVLLVGCGAAQRTGAVPAVTISAGTVTGKAAARLTATARPARRYVAPQGWSLRYSTPFSLEHSTSGPGKAVFAELTIASFAQRRAVVTGKTRDGGFIAVRPPLDRAGRFPTGGVAFRLMLADGEIPPVDTVADSRFPIGLSTFARPEEWEFGPSDYRTLGVPRELTRRIDADGQQYQALVFIGPAASASARAAIEAVIASLSFPRLHPGEQTGDETVLRLASDYRVGSFTLIHAPGEVCDGSVYHCHSARRPFYLVRAPGRLRQPDMIEPCAPSAAACTPPGAFYALGWTTEDLLGGYRSSCHLRFDRRDEQFSCTNSSARWNRTGNPLRVPPGASAAEGLQFAFAKVSWDGHVVLLAGSGENPPRAKARALLWPRRG